MTRELLISVDIEADGPIPGPYSMLALGMAVCGVLDGGSVSLVDPAEQSFYRELQPISDKWDADALLVARLDRDELTRSGSDPKTAMRDAAKWVESVSGGTTPVAIGYPIVFDWMFLHWYFVRFLGSSPFGFSQALDMKTLFAARAQRGITESGMSELPGNLSRHLSGTHNAKQDAIDQGRLFGDLWRGNLTAGS